MDSISAQENIHVTTILHICHENLNDELVYQNLPDLKGLIRRKGEVMPSDPNSLSLRSSRDPRWHLDRWSCGLTGKQGKSSLEQQLVFWLQRLYPKRDFLKKLVEGGCWIAIDCRLSAAASSNSSIQFRVDNSTLIKFSKIYVDLDFTIW
jgi:hypothetical protein